MELINGNKFTGIAHYYLDEHILGGGLRKEILMNNSIIFCKTDYIKLLFNFIKFSSKKYILITHNSDYSIDFSLFSLKPNSIIKWYAQNVEIDHPDLINIPIGLENEIRRNGTPIVDYPWFYKNMDKWKCKKKIKDTVYCNWDPNTNSSRNFILNSILDNGINIEVEKERLSHKEYCEKASEYKYIVCPRGNGISTHRFWETLYFGSIPIVINHIIYKNYTLPIIRLKKWEDLNNELLDNFIEEEYSMEMLDFNYWRKKILNEYKRSII